MSPETPNLFEAIQKLLRDHGDLKPQVEALLDPLQL